MVKYQKAFKGGEQMENIKASIITLGCRVNQYESDAIMQELSKNGVEICSHNETCDIYIVNTSGATPLVEPEKFLGTETHSLSKILIYI